jgi:hypothetical protein
MTNVAFVTMACAMWLAGTAAAQPPAVPSIQPGPARSFAELEPRVNAGETVDVVDTSGVRTRGTVVAIEGVSLTVLSGGNRRTFAESAVSRVERRRRDSRRNGLLIGLGSGALVGFLAGRGADSPTCPRTGLECGQGVLLGTVGGATWGAVGGWVTDTLVRKREVLYAGPF